VAMEDGGDAFTVYAKKRPFCDHFLRAGFFKKKEKKIFLAELFFVCLFVLQLVSSLM
jgi:hypothetical protein